MKIESAVFETSVGDGSQLFPSTLPEVVFSGRYNVGKSSLINRLLSRKSLARTSATPGKTATINFYRLDTVRLVDLPGYGYAKVSDREKKKWSDVIRRYFEDDRDLRLVVQLVDIRHPPSADDRVMIDFFVQEEIPFLIALTKADKLNKSERVSRLAAFEEEWAAYEGVKWIPFSSVTGEGAEELREILEDVTA